MSHSAKKLFWVGVGVLCGLILVIVSASGYHYAGTSEFCGSCHSMGNVHKEWRISMHKSFACIECHMPDTNGFARLAYKAKAGMRDVYHETLRDYPVGIKLSDEGRTIVAGNCLRCHHATVENTPMVKDSSVNCIACHRHLVHGQGIPTRGLLHD